MMVKSNQLPGRIVAEFSCVGDGDNEKCGNAVNNREQARLQMWCDDHHEVTIECLAPLFIHDQRAVIHGGLSGAGA